MAQFPNSLFFKAWQFIQFKCHQSLACAKHANTYIFHVLIPTILPRLYVCNIIMNVGLDISDQLINIEGKAKNMKYSK